MSVEAIEQAAATAWPASEQASMGEWVLSAGRGFSRRRNSAVPAGPRPPDLEKRLADVEAWYNARRLDHLYRITPMCDLEIDRVLAERGFAMEAPTAVLSKPIGATEMPRDVATSPFVTDGWISIELDALGIDRSLVGPWLEVIRSVPSPATFVTSMHGMEPVGAAFGVVVGRLLGVFEVAVRPDDRRRGHAKRMMSALHSFGQREGAEHAFLQVEEEDDATVDLYGSIGYEVSHRYWYRRTGLEGQ